MLDVKQVGEEGRRLDRGLGRGGKGELLSCLSFYLSARSLLLLLIITNEYDRVSIINTSQQKRLDLVGCRCRLVVGFAMK